MRLWHQKLIPHLDRQRLLGQHRECAALRGKGWGKKHKIVDYVFTHDPDRLVAYHYLIMNEMENRGYHPDPIWRNPNWRGTTIGEAEDWAQQDAVDVLLKVNDMIYPEHNDEYLRECVENLQEKGVVISEDLD